MLGSVKKKLSLKIFLSKIFCPTKVMVLKKVRDRKNVCKQIFGTKIVVQKKYVSEGNFLSKKFRVRKDF